MNEYDALVAKSLRPDLGQAARVGYFAAIAADTDPDAYAEAQRIARRTGVPVDTALRTPKEVKTQDAMGAIDFDTLAKTAPATAALLADVERAKLTHDDLPSLIAIERSFLEGITEPVRRGIAKWRRGLTLELDQMGVFKGLERRQTAAAAAHGITYDPLAALDARLAQQQREIDRYPVPEGIAQGMQEISSARTMGEAFTAIRTNPRAVLEVVLESLGASAPSLVGAIGGSVFGPVGRAIGTGLGSFTAEYGNTLQEVMAEKGVDGRDPMAIRAALDDPELMAAARDKALKRGIPIAIFDAITAGLAGKLLAGAKPTVASVGGRAAGELAMQAAGGAAGEAGAQLATGEYKPGDILLEAFAEMPTAFVEAVGSYQHAFAKAAQAEANAKAIEKINDLARASKVLKRDPDTFEQFIAAAAENGPVQQVFLGAQALMQSGVAEQVAAVSPSVAAQLETAVQTGGQIAIPVEEYAARIAPTEYAQSLLDHIKTDPEGFSRAEAQQYMQSQAAELKQEVERIMAEQQVDDEFRASKERVKQMVLDNLNAIGRFAPWKNEFDAILIAERTAVRAAQRGMLPEDFFAQQLLRVRATAMPGQQFSQDGKLMTDTPAFQNWFGESKVKDADGQPLVMYHGTVRDFSSFDNDKKGATDHGWYGVGAGYFTADPDTASAYSVYRDIDSGMGFSPIADGSPNAGANVMPVYLSIKNPYMWPEGRAAATTKDEAQAITDELIAAGYDGVIVQNKYAEEGNKANFYEVVAFYPSQIKSAIGNRGTFDPADPNILHQSAQGSRGAFSPATNTITLLQNADLSTFLHEAAHYFFEGDIALASDLVAEARSLGYDALKPGERQILDDVSTLLRWHGIQGDIEEQLRQWHAMDFEERRTYHERTAESFEKYLLEGKAPSIELQRVFQVFRAWLLNVYRSIKAFLDRHPEAGKLNDEVRGVFDRMLATNEQIILAEQARSMMPLFASPEQAGMTPEEFAAYQALGIDASNTAIQELQAKGLRDMQWLAAKRGRVIAKLQKQAKALRAEAMIEARREVMSQPVYRAWDFLTRKLSDDDKIGTPPKRKSDPDVLDPSQDSLFVAIAKLGGLRKDQVISKWGVDPKDAPQSGLFGKPVWRLTDGLTLDSMADALAAHGYLTLDEHGKYDLREFEDKFFEELRGNAQYSIAYDYAANEEMRAGDQVVNPQALSAGRLDLAELQAMGLPTEIFDAVRARRMTARNGLHPDIVAEMFGFGSGDELVRALAAAEAPKVVIERLTDRIMLERHGELSSPEAIEEAADMAIHNEVRARFVATEANALAKATGQRKLLLEAAKEFAAAAIARQRVRDLSPAQYTSAGARAAKAAEKAIKAGDIRQAAIEARNQTLNIYLARAAYEAREEAASLVRNWSAFARRADAKLLRSYDLDLVNAVRAILGEYGVAQKQAKRAGEYLKTLERLDPEMYATVRRSIDAAEANAKPVAEMTMEELRGLKAEIDAILHLAKRSRQIEINGELLDRQDVEDALFARLQEIGVPDRIPGEGQAVTPAEQRMTTIRSLRAAARRVESWIDAMDGGERFGPFRRFVWTPISDAAIAYRADKARYLKQYRDLIKTIAPTLKPSLIAAPELGYTFGKDTGGSAINEILHAILHTGNPSNKRKLLLGRKWAVETAPGQLDTTQWDAFIARMVREGKITREHFDFVQGVWDMLESMKDLAQKAHRDVFGRYFDEVTAEGFIDPFGVPRRGGYVPAIVDTRLVKEAELRELADEENAAMSYAFPTTPKGFTKARVEYNRELMLDLRTLAQHIDKVLLFSHMEVPVRDVQRMLSKRVGEALSRIDSSAINGLLRPWLNRSARQQVETPIIGAAGAMRFFTKMRARAGMAPMFGNLANALQQFTGFALAALKVKPGLLLEAAAGYAKNPREFTRAVAEASPYMDHRMHHHISEMASEIDEILLNPSLLESAEAWTMRHAYFLQTAVDNTVSPIVWTGAYNQAVAEGRSHDDAVRLADSAVRLTQGSLNPEDVSRIETGNAFVRIFTQFIGHFIMNANLLGSEYVKLMRDAGLRKGAGRGVLIFVLGFMVPAVVSEIIVQLFRGGPGDEDEDGEYLDDWLAATFGWGQLRYATAMVPGAGQVVNAAVNAWNKKPYDDRIATAPAISMLESSVAAPVSVYEAIKGEGSSQKAVRDVATLVSMTLGVPAYFVARPVGYLAGVAEGRIEPTDPLDFTRGLVTGVASPESKQ